jgi:phosphoserine phosphatase RsbU/P
MEKLLLRHFSKFRAFSGGIIALFLIYNIISIYLYLPQILTNQIFTPGWEPEYENQKLIVQGIFAPEPEKLLKVGDEVLAINGQPVHYPIDTFSLLNPAPNTSYSLKLRRNNQIKEVTLSYNSIKDFSLFTYSKLLVSLIFFITGITLYFIRSSDLRVLLSSLLLNLSGTITLTTYMYYQLPLGYFLNFVYTLQSFSPAIFFYLFLIFPQKSPLIIRWPRLAYLPMICGGLLVTISLLPVTALINPQLSYSILSLTTQQTIEAGSSIISNFCYFLGTISLLNDYRQSDAVNKRKLRVMLCGISFSTLSYLIYYSAGRAIFSTFFSISMETLLYILSISHLLSLLFPICFAYAIIRHQVLPISIIIRRSMRYLLVTNGFIVLQLIAVLISLYIILYSPQLENLRTFDARTLILITLGGNTVLLFLSQIINNRVGPIIDRRFFRDTYTAQKLLTELGESVRQITDMQILVATITKKLQSALHSANITFLLRDEKTGHYHSAFSQIYQPKKSISSAPPPKVTWEKHFLAVYKVSKELTCVDFDLTDPDCWWHKQATNLEDQELELACLRTLNPALLIPITNQNSLEAIIVLGPKLAEIPYTREDKQMLMSAALQIGLALENTKLISQAVEEQKLKKELEMAMEVQQRLFPQTLPSFPTLEIAACCFPARGVGGDYYDFIELDPQHLGIAVADVAGKGLSAALLMSVVKTSLHSQVYNHEPLIKLMTNINHLLYQSTNGNTHASFFYGTYNHLHRTLTYVNAGHNPPLLLRAQTTIIATPSEPMLSLTTGGLVIGLLDFARYEQATITLQPGDILVAFTDGVSEALNKDGEEFGEERLEACILAHRHLNAEALREKLVEALQDWCTGTPQYDDITLVVLKV